jgi:hypothetical protein
VTKTRIVNKRYAQKGQRTTGGASWLLAVVGFLIVLVGLAVILRGGCAGQAERRAVAKKIVEALDRTTRADRALEAGNYGDARQQVKRIQSTLTEALGDMQQESSGE